MKVASFFSGIGGFDLGFERAGMTIVFQCEINPFCKKVLRKHWPTVKLMDDINQVKISDMPEVDLWCAGFPCQDVSLANQGKRRGLDGERSGLFFTLAKLIEQKRPPWLVIENVTGLLNSNEGEDFRCVISTLDELGYICTWRVLDAKYFRTPQRRRRVIIVASYRNASSIEVLLDPSTIKAIPLQGKDQKRSNAKWNEAIDPETDYISVQHGCIGRKPNAGPQSKGWRADGETWTLDSRGSSDVVCSTTHAFRVREASRIPEGLDGNRFRAIGNAVPVPVTTWLGKRIMKVAKKRKHQQYQFYNTMPKSY